MKVVWDSNQRKIALNIKIKCSGKKNFRVWAEEKGKPNSKYADRVIKVDGEREITFSFPFTPDQMVLGCVNFNDANDTQFKVTADEVPLKTYSTWIDNDTREFLQLAMRFCSECGYVKPSKRGNVYQTSDAYFNIKYFPVIMDRGKPMSTPARVGHRTGIIEVSAQKFMRYTIPMRMMILLHEFGHKYKNPQINLPISDEIGADINALYIYMGMGFSKIDAITVFSKVFLSADSDSNMVRIRKIQDYIAKFEREEFVPSN